MNPTDFIRKWSDATLRERQGSQEHFIDLCHLLGQPTPAEDDPHGDRYCFERGATKAGGGDGWADVWRRGCFGWEYKGPHKDLNAAFRQLTIYASNLESPPYLVVSDMARIIVHTNWTNTVSRKIELSLEDLRDPANLDLLRQVFEGSDRLKPGVSPQELTQKVAARFGELGRRLQERRAPDGEPLHHPREIAHFLNRLVFCMFAEDARLLPDKLFTRLLKGVERRPHKAAERLDDLFEAMREGGDFGVDVIRWFNGGLFDEAPALPLEAGDLKLVIQTAEDHDWSQIDPAIFGTLFEEALKATRQRAALGAHYTDRAKILKIVDPVIVWPLTAEWEASLARIAAHGQAVRDADARRRAVMEAAGEAMKADPHAAKAGEGARRKKLTTIAKDRDGAIAAARDELEAFLSRLAAYRVLDPACGSGNFLYVALHALRDLEKRAMVDAERAAGIPQQTPRVGLNQLHGIEIEAYAAELARVTLWIGDLQWQQKNGYTAYAEPILSSLTQIENRDALLNPDGTEADWPEVEAIIGNPPFLGAKRMRSGGPEGGGALGDDYVEMLREVFKNRLPGFTDFVTYWLEKGRAAALANPSVRCGFVTTNSVRGGSNRRVLDRISDDLQIVDAWADEPWVVDGAAVRVSMISFAASQPQGKRLNGLPTAKINPDLTGDADTTHASILIENKQVAFVGIQPSGPFTIEGELARKMLREPSNVNGRPNSDVIKRYTNGAELIRNLSDSWILDFSRVENQNAAALFEKPFLYLSEHVKPVRAVNKDSWARDNWWLFWRMRNELRQASDHLARYMISPRVAKFRFFVWRPTSVLADSATIAIARDDDTTFGILHSRFHELWSLRMGTWLGVGNDPRYTPSTTFETFPFPEGLTPNTPAADYADDPRAVAIAQAARELNTLRENWLNPADLVRIEPEVVPGYPDRVLPRDEEAAKVLKTRTLTTLYNQRPAWLDMAHKRLDAAVAAAYDWPADLSDEAVLEHLFALNQERAAAGR